jgi:hypothetical protein
VWGDSCGLCGGTGVDCVWGDRCGFVCGATSVDLCVRRQVWIFQEGPFPGSRESDKKVHCCSGNVLIISAVSQQT